MTRARKGRETARPIVVKIGGSLAGSARLRRVLGIVAAAPAPVIVVPGGGRLADAVRAEQARLQFSDEAAHEMALLAMHQMARLFAEMQPKLRATETFADMRRARDAGRIPIWLPFRLALADPSIPANWSSTSDGLAARLAERLKARAVVLIKSCAVSTVETVSDPLGLTPAKGRTHGVRPRGSDTMAPGADANSATGCAPPPWLGNGRREAVAVVPSAHASPTTSRRSLPPHALAHAGIVDPLFAEIVARAAIEWHIVGPGEEHRLSSLLG